MKAVVGIAEIVLWTADQGHEHGRGDAQVGQERLVGVVRARLSPPECLEAIAAGRSTPRSRSTSSTRLRSASLGTASQAIWSMVAWRSSEVASRALASAR